MAAVSRKLSSEKVDCDLRHPPPGNWCNLPSMSNVWINEYLAVNLGKIGSYFLVMKELNSS